ncbi:MAG: hypothetical protein ABL883_05415 [Terricaulis sp.]
MKTRRWTAYALAGIRGPGAAFNKLRLTKKGFKLSLSRRDAGRRRSIFLALGSLALIAAAAPTPILLRAQAWTTPGADLAAALTREPRECLGARTPETEIGRALFRSPALFGGPAARMGLSCNACHTNGRINAHFFAPELTDRTSAADVTSEWSSRVRGDGISNPVDIPDLVGVGGREAFGRGRDPSLEHFTSGVIGEEFQGPTPPPQALAGLLAYLRALAASACQPGESVITLASAADDVRRALSAAASAEPETASLLALSARDAMGRIAERLPAHTFRSERARLERLSRELGRMRATGNIGAALEGAGWRARFDALVARLARREQRSYFNEATLRGSLR